MVLRQTTTGDARAARFGATAARKRPPQVLAGAEIVNVVARRVVGTVLARSEEPRGHRLDEVVHETIYTEQKRLASCAPDPRTGADREWVSWLRKELPRASGERLSELVYAIVERYLQEISGHFDRRVYRFATGVGALTVGDHVVIEGETEALRSLAKVGTVIIAPTHVSNLDSLVLGYAIYRLGLPPFAYGAGLNLFSNAFIGFFLRNLGAYTVDRTKSDPLYRATLKEYATVLLEKGQHNLFFPGGTRSHSGAVERHLKKGLLGTAAAAFRDTLEAGSPNPRIFVVPCTLNYPLVLEASSLVEGFLKTEGGPHYVDVRDEFDRPQPLIDFARGLLESDLQIRLRFGHALDLVGNEVDPDGTSRDPRGRAVDPARYFVADGHLAADATRDAAYTRNLEEQLVASYRRETVTLATNVLAYVLFERLRLNFPQPDLFRFLRGLGPEVGVSVSEILSDIARVQAALIELETAGAIRVSSDLRRADPERALEQALTTFGTYHAAPVVTRSNGELHVGDPNLLFYYRNRLEGYGL